MRMMPATNHRSPISTHPHAHRRAAPRQKAWVREHAQSRIFLAFESCDSRAEKDTLHDCVQNYTLVHFWYTTPTGCGLANSHLAYLLLCPTAECEDAKKKKKNSCAYHGTIRGVHCMYPPPRRRRASELERASEGSVGTVACGVGRDEGNKLWWRASWGSCDLCSASSRPHREWRRL